MEASLRKQQRAGDIEWVRIGVKEFYVRDLKSGKLSVIFYDNKYRQDTLSSVETKIASIDEKIKHLEENSFGTGLLNTEQEVGSLQEIRSFLKNHKK
jgi:hypothetical protein